MEERIWTVRFKETFNEVEAIRRYYENVYELFASGEASCFLVPEGNPFFTYKWASEIQEFASEVPHFEALNEIFNWAATNGRCACFKRITDFEDQTFVVLEVK